MIDRNHTILVVIDVQERMMPAIEGEEAVVANVVRLVQGARLLGLPMLVTEQYPQGLGPTVPEVRAAMGDEYRPMEKISFSACGDMTFMNHFEQAPHHTVLLCGVESHVCLYQTARDLRNLGHNVEVVADAAGSRSRHNHEIALARLARHGVEITSVELALFEIMERADIPEFKDVQRIVK